MSEVSKRSRDWGLRLVLGLALLTRLAGPALASPAGKLIGTVKNAQGGVLAGATVSASSPALLGGGRTTRSGADGTFVFPDLEPGLYTVKVELEGFHGEELRGVRVSLSRTTAIFPELTAGELHEEITVTAEHPLVDPMQVAAGQVFTLEFLDRSSIGADDRSYLSIAGSAAGVAQSELTEDPQIFGSTGSENVYLIDGLDTTDPQTATFGTNFNFDAIKEISLSTAGFEAEYGRATGGVVNLITKSGGNDFSGTFDVRYRDNRFVEKGQHSDSEEGDGDNSFVLPAATLGGPLARDRIWFFTSAAYQRQQTTPSLSPITADFKGQDYLGKISWQIDPRWRAVFKGASSPATFTAFNAGPFVDPAAAATERQRSVLWQAESSGQLSDRLLWELQLGVHDRKVEDGPRSGDLQTPGVIDLDTQISSGNYTRVQSSSRHRTEAQTSLTSFVDGFGGSHEWKTGASYAALTLDALDNATGGALYTDQGGPFLYSVTPELPSQTYRGNLTGGYVQDAWRLLPALTLKLGLRYDRASYSNELHESVATLAAWQPRLGFAWDLTGDARTVLRGSYGKFMHPSALALPLYARLTFAPTTRYLACSQAVDSDLTDPEMLAAACQAFASARGGAVIQDPLHRDPYGFAFYDALSTSPNQVDPNLRPTVANEYTIGLQRQLGRRTSVELSYVNKATRNVLEDTCSENVPQPAADPGFENCHGLTVTNPAAARRDYRGLLLRFESREVDWLDVVASYAYSSSRGSVENPQISGPDFDVYPVHFANAYGYLSDDRRHRLKLKGFVKLPREVSVGFNAIYESPFDYSVLQNLEPPLYGTAFLEPRGSRRANSTSTLEIELRKGFRLAGLDVELIGTVENVLGTERPVAVCQFASGCTSADGDELALGDPIDFQPPRRYEVGFRMVF
ncbi:MAG TPA: TonB-dependent receptor [Thermoanaerobaculia bacterium]|nr:TonB-dependent receptor [Thermoanaerobaculia bacterium]